MQRKYGLFELIFLDGGKFYTRVEGTGSYPKPQAIKVFQGRLLAYGPLVKLLPVKE